MLPFQWAMGLCRQVRCWQRFQFYMVTFQWNRRSRVSMGFKFGSFLKSVLRWANKIRCWLPIAGNTKISPGEPCRKRIAGGDRWWLTFCGSSRGRRFCRGVVFYVSKVTQCWWSTDDSIWFSHQLGSKCTWIWYRFLPQFHTISKIPCKKTYPEQKLFAPKKTTGNLGFPWGFGRSPSCWKIREKQPTS